MSIENNNGFMDWEVLPEYSNDPTLCTASLKSVAEPDQILNKSELEQLPAEPVSEVLAITDALESPDRGHISVSSDAVALVATGLAMPSWLMMNKYTDIPETISLPVSMGVAVFSVMGLVLFLEKKAHTESE